MEKIVNNFERLNLHDSHFENIEKNRNEFIIYIDWAYLSDYIENDIDKGIILGKTKITIIGYTNEEIEINFRGTLGYEKKESIISSYSEEIYKNWEVILENKIDNTIKQGIISGTYYYEKILCWIDWKFSFEKIIIQWDKFILHEDWQKGININE